MIFVNSSAPMNAQSSSSCSLEFLRVKSLSFSSKSPFSRPNCVLFIEHEVWPNFGGISEPFTLGKRRRSASGGLADRSALNWRSIGAYAALRNCGSRSIGLNSTIDRRCFWLTSRSWADRSANEPQSIGIPSAFLALVIATSADRSAAIPRSIDDGSVYVVSFSFAPKCSVLCTFSPRFPYLCLNHLYTHKTH